MADYKQYSPDTPRNNLGDSLQLPPATTAIARTFDTTISTDTEVALNAATKLIEITAISQGIFLRWKTATGGTAVSSSNFDEFIAAGTTRHYVRPNSITHLSVIEQAASATLVLIEK